MRYLLVLAAVAAWAQPVTLENGTARAVFQLAGGSLTDFHLKDQKLNPFTWEPRGDNAANRPRGHFVCFDRWGQPSAAELKNGMPFHGEATRVAWTKESGGAAEVRMTALLPMAGLAIERHARMGGAGSLRVTETVTNRNKLGRMYNLVQHPTIAPPFLDASTVVDTNAKRGFMQSSPMPNPEEPPVWWPQALKDGQAVNLRHLTDDPLPNVVSYTIDEEWGWVTAATPGQGLLVGYLWKVREYPWLNIWRDVRDGKPAARGLEFGTTGLHQPFSVLVAKEKIFGRPLYDYLDAGESAARSYAVFLAKIPADFKGAAKVSYDGSRVTVEERGAPRKIVIETGALFPD
jgi:hypothetical protein